jgi:ammonium transporter, Amt family
MTPLILIFIKYVLRIPLKYDDHNLVVGDDAIHGESQYVLEHRRRPSSLQESIQE